MSNFTTLAELFRLLHPADDATPPPPGAAYPPPAAARTRKRPREPQVALYRLRAALGRVDAAAFELAPGRTGFLVGVSETCRRAALDGSVGSATVFDLRARLCVVGAAERVRALLAKLRAAPRPAALLVSAASPLKHRKFDMGREIVRVLEVDADTADVAVERAAAPAAAAAAAAPQPGAFHETAPCPAPPSPRTAAAPPRDLLRECLLAGGVVERPQP